MRDTTAIVLAAGKGTRMKSSTPKVLHKILGVPTIHYIIDSLKETGIEDIIVVAGYGSELLRDEVKGVKIAIQKKLLGSADAVKSAENMLGRHKGDILIVCGDAPLIRCETLKALVNKHKHSGAVLTVLTAKPKDPASYGRIVRGEDGKIKRISEAIEIDGSENLSNEVNSGIYCTNGSELFGELTKITRNNKKGEFYLTDIVEILCDKGCTVESMIMEDPDEMTGINTRADLAKASGIMKSRIAEVIMSGGVTIEDPSSTVIYPGAKIGRDSVIYSNTVIESDVEIGKGCHIGPFARIRPGVRLDDDVEIGNFVELVRTRVGAHTKIKHHTYLGDSTVGKNVNIGAGTITANYDGKNKNRTIIEDNAFIGVGAILIAPVKIAKYATVGAGCVVPKNHDVPSHSTVVGIPARIFKTARKSKI